MQTAVLVIHGFTAQPKTVGHVAGYLERAGLPFEIPTLRGHGTRMEDLDGVPWQDWLADASAAYERLEAAHGSVAVIGHSMGALLGAVLAARKPRTAALALVAPALEYKNKLAYTVPYLASLVRYWDWGPSGITDGALRAQAEAEAVTYKRFPTRSFGELFKLRAVVLRELGQVRAPALVIQSRFDESLPPQGAQKTYALLGSRDKSLEWLERGGHEVFWDADRDVLCARLVSFVQEKAKVPAGV